MEEGLVDPKRLVARNRSRFAGADSSDAGDRLCGQSAFISIAFQVLAAQGDRVQKLSSQTDALPLLPRESDAARHACDGSTADGSGLEH